MKAMKAAIKYCFHQLRLFVGFIFFLLTGKNSQKIYQSLLAVFFVDRGATMSIYEKILRLFYRPLRIQKAEGIFGELSPDKLTKIANDLREHGYSISDVFVPEDICKKLEEVLLCSQSYPVRPSPDSPLPPPGKYNPQNLVSSYYGFKCKDLIGHLAIQDLMADKSLLSIANEYFQAMPILDSVIMSVSTDFTNQPIEDAAQLFHFDMERIKWLKFFLYLSDVDDLSGPHVFVEGTHKNSGIQKSLLERGYARIRDEEIGSVYPQDKIKVFKGRRGTLFVEDTRGLHKGQVLQKGSRLMLQVQYDLGLFGTPDLHKHKLPEVKSERLKVMVAKYPRVYSNFKVGNLQ
jgi:hypothetical protein